MCIQTIHGVKINFSKGINIKRVVLLNDVERSSIEWMYVFV